MSWGWRSESSTFFSLFQMCFSFCQGFSQTPGDGYWYQYPCTRNTLVGEKCLGYTTGVWMG